MTHESTKILVVDDDPFVREMLAVILQEGGYTVETAEHGGGAIEKYTALRDIGLVVSDMNMPGMSGLDLLRELQKIDSEVPIIILTGNNEISVAIEAMNSGASDYLLKDENIQDTVVLSVEKVLEKHELKKRNLQLMADLAERNERLEREMALAQKVQMKILPERLDFNGFDISTFYRPSGKIGGDFFDAWETDGRVHFLVCDVSGHSASSALIMAFSKGIFRSIGSTLESPLAIITASSRMLCDILGDSGMFLTLVYGTFERATGRLDFVSAGHNPVFHVKGGEVRTIDSTGPVIGWDDEDTWDMLSLEFKEGESLFLYTDGLTESKNREGDEFGEGRLLELCREGASPDALVKHVFDEVSAFCSDAFNDDVTMFVIRRRE